MKQCMKCKTTQPLSEFSKHHKSPDGHQYWCKTCAKAWRKDRVQDPDYRESRNSKIREYHRARLISRQRNAMRWLIRRISPALKTGAAKDLLGYSVEEFCRHIESQFLPGMSWEKRSAWHIDHIKPVSAFIAEGIRDPKIINALSNLCPLWVRDNLAKGVR